MTLKTRIAIAVAAIVMVYVCFHTIPRKYYAAPRFQPSGYDAALDLMKTQYGGDTVASGMVSIPRSEVVAPYEGLAISYSLIPMLVMRMSPEATGVLLRDSQGQIYGGRITYGRARRIWGCLAYIELATTSDKERFDPERSGRTVGGTLLVELGDPRIRREGKRLPVFRFHAEEMCADDVIKDETRSALIESLVSECGSTDSALFAQTAGIVLRAMTRPQTEAEGYALETFLDPYVTAAGEAAMPLLLELEKSGKTPNLPPMPVIDSVPKLKQFIVSVAGKKRPGGQVTVDIEKQMLDALAIDSAEKRTDLLAAKAFPVTTDYHEGLAAEKSRRLSADMFPDEWKSIAIANYDKIPDWEKGGYVASEDKARAAGVEMVRRLSEDEGFTSQTRALYMLYLLTKDRACIETLERMAADYASTDVEKAKSAFWAIARLSVEVPESADYAAAARRILHATCPPNWDLGWSVVSAMPYGIEGTMSLADDLINAPEKVLSDEYIPGTPNRLRQAAMEAAAKYGGIWERNPLVTFVANLNPDDDPQFYYQALECLCNSHDTRAASVLTEILEREKQNPTKALVAIHQAKTQEPFETWLKRRTIISKLDSMKDLAAIDYYYSLGPEDKALIGVRAVLGAVGPAGIRKLVGDSRFYGNAEDVSAAVRVWDDWPQSRDDVAAIRKWLKERDAKK